MSLVLAQIIDSEKFFTGVNVSCIHRLESTSYCNSLSLVRLAVLLFDILHPRLSLGTLPEGQVPLPAAAGLCFLYPRVPGGRGHSFLAPGFLVRGFYETVPTENRGKRQPFLEGVHWFHCSISSGLAYISSGLWALGRKLVHRPSVAEWLGMLRLLPPFSWKIFIAGSLCLLPGRQLSFPSQASKQQRIGQSRLSIAIKSETPRSPRAEELPGSPWTASPQLHLQAARTLLRKAQSCPELLKLICSYAQCLFPLPLDKTLSFST